MYNSIKSEYFDSLINIIGETEQASIQAFKSTIFKPEFEEGEERIECLCGQYKDEGLMIQCEKCQVWQHCDCVGQSGEDESESYLCPKCGDREAVLDIPLVPQPEYASPGEKYFVSLSRCESLQVRVGDTVYVLRAFKNKNDESGNRNEGLLKVAPNSQKQKKKSQEKKKEKSVVTKVKSAEKEGDEITSVDEVIDKPCDNKASIVERLDIEETNMIASTSKTSSKNSTEDKVLAKDDVTNLITNEMETTEGDIKEMDDRMEDKAEPLVTSGTLESKLEIQTEKTPIDNVNENESKTIEQTKKISETKVGSELIESHDSVQNPDILKKDPTEKSQKPPTCLTPPHVEIENPLPGENDPSKSETDKKRKVVNKDQFCHGGIPHKMMSPTKGPALEASSLAKGNYPTYKSVDENLLSTDDMDIFRIERIWTNEAGQRFAFGHHYLRPHETFHEPSRRFFPNEVFRVPIYEVLPLDTIWRQCWVLDLQTFCKGRPVGAKEEHIYICENRVDKTARLFHKISKAKYPICTKWFAFNHFDLRLRPQRTYTVSNNFYYYTYHC